MRFIGGKFQIAAIQFVLQRFPGNFGQRLGIPRQTLQFTIAHGGVGPRQTIPFIRLLKVGHWEQDTAAPWWSPIVILRDGDRWGTEIERPTSLRLWAARWTVWD